MLVILLAITAVSGCTSGSMNVTPTPGATAAPTITPTAAPAATPVTTPTATAVATPAATPAPTPVPSKIPYWLGPYPTMGPWVPGDDTYVPTPTADAGYLISSPWINQKEHAVGAVILKIKGNVYTPLSLKKIDLQNYPQKTSTWNNPSNASKSFTASGPELNALLDAAGIKPGATSIKLVSSDGSTYTMSIADVRADSNAIVGLMSDGSLRTCMPSQTAGKAQLRGLIEIDVI